MTKERLEHKEDCRIAIEQAFKDWDKQRTAQEHPVSQEESNKGIRGHFAHTSQGSVL